LEEYTEYVIMVSLINRGHIIANKTITANTDAAFPSAAPTYVNVTKQTSNSITIQWGPVECVHRNGEITGYLVRYRQSENGTILVMNVDGGSVSETSIRSLMSNTSYKISIVAVNSVGIGSISINTSAWTSEEKSLKVGIIPLVGAVAGTLSGAMFVFVLIITLLILLLRWKNNKGSVKIKSKPLPFPRMTIEWGQEGEREGERETVERIEMKCLVTEQYKNKISDDLPIFGQSGIPTAEFPAYVREIHLNGSDKLKLEYTSLEKLPLPSTEVARLPCNLPHNRFRNIYPCE
jgi:hypothetical protein